MTSPSTGARKGMPCPATHRSMVRAGTCSPASPPLVAGASGLRPLSALQKTGFDAVRGAEAGSSLHPALGIELVEINKIKF